MAAKYSAYIPFFRKAAYHMVIHKLTNRFRIDREEPDGDGWDISTTAQQLVGTFPTLDPRIHQLMLSSEDIKIWRLYIHKPYPYWARGRVALLGDAAHPMLPDQTQGHSQAIEDAAALGLIFSKYYYTRTDQTADDAIAVALKRYERVRMKRATALQDASTKAREDIRERIGWAAEGVKPGKLTIEDLCGYDMEEHLAEIVASESLSGGGEERELS
jgi:salicylate hydroxylase